MNESNKLFHPMLACSKLKHPEKLKFPLLASVKLDGIRATVQNGQLLSRTLKPIPNKAIQAIFKGLPDGLDGELILGDPTAHDVFRKTTSKVMSPDEDARGIVFYIFDLYSASPFEIRFNALKDWVQKNFQRPIDYVDQLPVSSQEELDKLEQKTLELGYEGLILRSINGIYKQGRSTEKEGYLLKLKRFEHDEAEVIGFEEMMHNDNEAQTNELGRTKRQTLQENLRPAGVLGALIVRDLKTKVEFNIGTGFKIVDRQEIWRDQSKLKGKIVRYAHFLIGQKDKPRQPVFEGFRDIIDI